MNNAFFDPEAFTVSLVTLRSWAPGLQSRQLIPVVVCCVIVWDSVLTTCSGESGNSEVVGKKSREKTKKSRRGEIVGFFCGKLVFFQPAITDAIVLPYRLQVELESFYPFLSAKSLPGKVCEFVCSFREVATLTSRLLQISKKKFRLV